MRFDMKKFLFTLIAFACMFSVSSCGEKPADDITTIKGNVPELALGSVACINDNNEQIDTTLIQDGKFEYKLKLESPQKIMLMVKDSNNNFYHMLYLFVGKRDKININIAADSTGRKVYTVTGAPLEDEFKEYTEYIKSLEVTKLYKANNLEVQKAYMDGDKLKVNELNRQNDEYKKGIITEILKSKANSASSPVAASFVYDYARNLSVLDREWAMSQFGEDASNLHYLSVLKSETEADKRVDIGAKAPDFKLQDLSGREYSLADFKGKYVYMDFSASWCGWCKKEIPFIREAYHKYKNDNIVFVTMNMDDSKEKWEGDVKAENIEWLTLSDCKGIKSDFAKSYNIGGIPAIFVLDTNGVIINKDVRMNELLPYIESLLKR